MPECRVLLVEDEPLISMLAEDILAGAGCEVVLASEGHRAMALIEQGPAFHFAMVDLSLPDIDGEAVVRALWERSPVPVIVSTGYKVLPDSIAVELWPFPAPLVFLSKPWDVDELCAAVRRFMPAADPDPSL